MVRDDPSNEGDKPGEWRPPVALYLLFAKGNRPDRSALFGALDNLTHISVSHDPADRDPEGLGPPADRGDGFPDDGEWLELLNWGMTFDLLGLSPGPGLDVPEIGYRFGSVAAVDRAGVEALALVPSPHIADGLHMLPILRAMLDLGKGLAESLEDVVAVCWSPARSAISIPVFTRAVDGWLDGGAFPALGLVGFAKTADGSMASEGLSHFIGQELCIDADLAAEPVAATRLGVRIIHQLVAAGPLEEPGEFASDDGSLVQLVPDPSGKTIMVRTM